MYIWRHLIALVLIISQFALHAQNFEGTIEFSVKITGSQAANFAGFMPDKMVYKFRNSDTRMTISGGLMPQDMLIKGNENVVWILQSAQKKAMRLAIENSKSSKEKSPKIAATEEFKDILGYKCRKYQLEMPPEKGQKKGNVAVFWVARDLKVKNPNVQGNKLFAEGIDGFPLQVDMEIGLENIRMQMLATSVDPNLPPETEFEIPAGYSKEEFKMPDFGLPGK